VAVVNLTPTFIETKLVCPPGKSKVEYNDAHTPGLVLEYRAAVGSVPSWRWRHKVDGKTRYLSLGSLKELSLDQARKKVTLLKAQAAITPRSTNAEMHAPLVPTMDEFWTEHVLPRIKKMKRSWRRDVQLYSRIGPRFGSKPLNQIKRLDVDQFLRDLSDEGLSHATANHHGQLMRRIVNLAVSGDLLERNPLQRLELFHLANQRQFFLDEEQVAKFCEVVGTTENRRVGLILLFLLSTGARLREALDAKWDQFDREKNIWRVPATNTKAKREIVRHLGDSALWVLNEVGSEGESEFVFPSPATGRPYTTITRAWFVIRRQAGLPGDVRIHDLRHSAASKIACETGSLVAVQHQLGHADGRMAARYSHATNKTMQAAARAASVPIPQRQMTPEPTADA
jgi:integrase